MNATKEIKIEHSTHDETGWKRYIHFTYEGESYELILFWDEFNGYEIMWRSPDKAPDWVVNWESDEHFTSFEYYLDDLTWEVKR